MECDEVRPRIDASIDGELSPAQEREVQRHLDGCAACRAEHDAVLAIRQAVRRAEYHAAPEALRTRIAAALEREPGGTDAPEPRHRPRLGGWKTLWHRPASGRPAWPAFAAARAGAGGTAAFAGLMAAAIAATVAVTLTLTLSLRGPGRNELFVDELVAAHVRAQLSGHGIDVVSTDQHTVKPWFNGRLDYTPPVADLASSGFTLAGGRLDYVAHRRVAVLVYRYRLHVIDVYVMPERDAGTGDSGSAHLVRDGYVLSHWRAYGMAWWAVTDAQPDILVDFRTALAKTLRDAQSESETGGAPGRPM